MHNAFLEKQQSELRGGTSVYRATWRCYFFPLCLFLCLVNTDCVSAGCVHGMLRTLSSFAIVRVNLCWVRPHPLEKVQSPGGVNLPDLCLPLKKNKTKKRKFRESQREENSG